MINIEFKQDAEHTEFIIDGHATDVEGKGSRVACTLVTGIVSGLYLEYGGVAGSGRARISVPHKDEECCRDVADAIDALEWISRQFFQYVNIK